MTSSIPAAVGSPAPVDSDSAYRPGVCNIGPAEIARRRRVGHIGAIVAVASLVVLRAIGAPRPARFLVALPAAGAASGYLQAWLRFCAGFGSRGVFNFGDVGTTERVDDAVARARDRAQATRIGVGSLAIGLAVGTVSALLPR